MGDICICAYLCKPLYYICAYADECVCVNVCLGVVKHTQLHFIILATFKFTINTFKCFHIVIQPSFFRTDYLWHYQSDSSCSVHSHQAFPRQAGVIQSRPLLRGSKRGRGFSSPGPFTALKAYTLNIPQHPLKMEEKFPWYLKYNIH